LRTEIQRRSKLCHNSLDPRERHHSDSRHHAANYLVCEASQSASGFSGDFRVSASSTFPFALSALRLTTHERYAAVGSPAQLVHVVQGAAAVKQGYTLDNAWAQERTRLRLRETVHDPDSIRDLERLRVTEGWHCLEVGAGGGSIAEWLCQKVGSSGHVLATDIDTRFLEVLAYPNLEVRRHNIAHDALPVDAFDLVHSRAVLIHLTERDQVLRSMVGALKPGGWLLVEESDLVSYLPDPRMPQANLYSRAIAAFNQVIQSGGGDVNYGRRLYADVCAAGLIDVDALGRLEMFRARSPLAQFWQLTFAQLRGRILDTGLLTDQEMDQVHALHDNAGFYAMSHTVMKVRGRKPG
jgi:SAM-dependent methyltransferase